MIRRLRRLTEVECYLRCYGAGDGTVRVVELESSVGRRTRTRTPRVSGEELRRRFEARLGAREAEAA